MPVDLSIIGRKHSVRTALDLYLIFAIVCFAGEPLTDVVMRTILATTDRSPRRHNCKNALVAQVFVVKISCNYI